MRARVLVALLAGMLATPALAQTSCPAPQQPMRDIELMLGRPDGSDARWTRFLADEVTPRFPNGLTVYETRGQWRDPRNELIRRERSRVLRIITPADAALVDKIDAIVQRYKKAFRQTSVGIIARDVCASF
jgi:hypothetical protein